jgi:Protein of unknown function (DUF1579)
MRGVLLGSVLIAGCASPPSRPFANAPRCDGPEYRRLDFWLGEWEVANPNGAREGANVISKTLDGCGIEERWLDAGGEKGTSLFYFDRARRGWSQVWVTSAGAWKEKREVTSAPGSVRFQGSVARPAGGAALDRTTLTPLPDGRVRQVIEQSVDGGATWRTWEGVYTRRKKACDARDFDFWLGDWEVTVHAKNGVARGSNSIRSVLGGCVIEENFHAEGPEAPWNGHSVSTFDGGRWRQTWVDDQGSYLAFIGEMKDGRMILYGEPKGRVRMRMVFAEIRADALLWTWERSEDDGASWAVQMTIDYQRRTAR